MFDYIKLDSLFFHQHPVSLSPTASRILLLSCFSLPWDILTPSTFLSHRFLPNFPKSPSPYTLPPDPAAPYLSPYKNPTLYKQVTIRPSLAPELSTVFFRRLTNNTDFAYLETRAKQVRRVDVEVLGGDKRTCLSCRLHQSRQSKQSQLREKLRALPPSGQPRAGQPSN